MILFRYKYMEDLISVENLIEEAKSKGINFGKGDPYNRLRYYTKIGWLPHMVRKKDSAGNTRGHYPISALNRLLEIEKLKESGQDNADISKKLKITIKLGSIIDFLKTPETRTQVTILGSFIILLLILSNELGIITLGKTKAALITDINPISTVDQAKQVLASGTGFVPKDQKKLFVQATTVSSNHKVYVTFRGNYSPAARYWVSHIEDQKGFTVELDAPVFSNVEFTWWITN
jgi:hypothetical protein